MSSQPNIPEESIIIAIDKVVTEVHPLLSLEQSWSLRYMLVILVS